MSPQPISFAGIGISCWITAAEDVATATLPIFDGCDVSSVAAWKATGGSERA